MELRLHLQHSHRSRLPVLQNLCLVCHDTVAPTVSAGLLNVITAVRICRFPVEVIPFLILYTHRNIEEIVNRQIRISGNVGISMILNRV